MRLTERSIARLDPAEKQYTAWDSEVAGLHVLVYPSGARHWYLDVRDKGTRRRHRRRLADATVVKPTEARRIAREMLGEFAAGRNPFAAQDARRETGTFREVSKAFIEAHRDHHAKNTIKTREGALAHVCKAFGSTPILAVTRDDVRRLHRSMLAAEYGPVTANRTVQVMRLVYKWADQEGRIPEGLDPTRGVKLSPEPQRHRVFSPDEYRRLEEALDDEATHTPSSMAACECLRFILLTGRRRDEVRTLRWENVDVSRALMRGIATKTGPRDFVIPGPALEVLKRMEKLRNRSPFVFPSPIDELKPFNNVNGVWDRVVKLARLPDKPRIHDARHSVGGTATALGLPVQSVAQTLGHESVASSGRYAAAHHDHARLVSEKVSSAIALAMRGDGSR